MIVRQNEVELCDGWTFQFEDEPPQSVSLPHTWNATDTMDTNPPRHYRRGRGTYTLDFTPPPGNDDKRLWLRFNAVAQRGQVTFDGQLIGEHHGGYTAFTVEVPNRPGKLCVIADNTPDTDLIPSDMSDFYLYGGITRSVTCYATGAARIEQTLFDIDTSAKRGEITLRGQLHKTPLTPLQLIVTLTHPGNNESNYTTSQAVKHQQFTFTLPDMPDPVLWSPDAPNLYTVQVTLQAGDTVLDTYKTTIGFRYFDFPDGGPFYLNGERLLLRGTHRHDDWAGYGAAVPRDLIEREMLQIKAAGFNFIRLGHYPQDDYTLYLCDSLGLIVWDELPWCRGGVGGETFKDHTRAMLREMIEQHYNHPSVVFWGLGNELDWEAEHDDSTDEKVAEFLQELHNLSHQMDPVRLTALRRFEQGAAIVDVYSPSIWSGWYRGIYADYERVLTDAMRRYPRLLHIEWGGDSHIGRHNDGPHIDVDVTSGYDHGEVPGTATSNEGFARYSRDGDWSESYMIDLMAHHLAIHAKLPRLAGTAQWVFKDFGTPLRPENPIPYVNQKGLVARDGTLKDVYHVFRAFQVNESLVHIESSAWALRVAGQQRVRVITNCTTVALFINGEHYGIQKKPANTPAAVLTWDVTLSPGEYTLQAVSDRTHHQIQVTVVQSSNKAAAAYRVFREQDVIHVQLVDADGHLVAGDERKIHFAGLITRHQGTMGGSDVIETANGQAWVRLAGNTANVTVSVEGLEEMTSDVC